MRFSGYLLSFFSGSLVVCVPSPEKSQILEVLLFKKKKRRLTLKGARNLHSLVWPAGTTKTGCKKRLKMSGCQYRKKHTICTFPNWNFKIISFICSPRLGASPQRPLVDLGALIEKRCCCFPFKSVILSVSVEPLFFPPAPSLSALLWLVTCVTRRITPGAGRRSLLVIRQLHFGSRQRRQTSPWAPHER